jgi:hypothetical protein
MNYRPRIAIVGAGVVGLHSALACSRGGADVDIYEAKEVPNISGNSYDYSRLFRIIHENNEFLQNLALLSHPYWIEMQNKYGNDVVKKSHNLRIIDDEVVEKIVEQYKKINISYEFLSNKNPLVHNGLYNCNPNLNIFCGHDSLLLNSKKIVDILCDEIRNISSIKIYPHSLVKNISLEMQLLFNNEKISDRYDGVIMATSSPNSNIIKCEGNDGMQPIKKFQHYINVYFDEEFSHNRTIPIVDFGDSKNSWSVPSINKNLIKLSASKYSFNEPQPENMIAFLNAELLKNIKSQFSKIENKIALYYEIDATMRLIFPYWRNVPGRNLITIDACDASIFKAAPAIASIIGKQIIDQCH